MTERKIKKSRPKPNQKQYLFFQFVGNFVGVLIVTPILVDVVFRTFGNGRGDVLTVQTFLIGFIACFTVIQTHGAIINTRKDFLRGKWIVDKGEKSLPSDTIQSPWSRVGVLTIIAGVVTATIMYIAVPYIKTEPYSRLAINIMAFIPLFLVSTFLIGIILPRDQASFTASLSKLQREGQSSFIRCFLLEFVLPWATLQGLINFGIGIKQFNNEAIKPEAITIGGVPTTLVATDFGIVFLIIIFFMWLASNIQVRPDVHLKRIVINSSNGLSKFVEKGNIPVVALLICFIGLSVIIGMIVGSLFNLAGIKAVSVTTAVILKTMAAVLGSFAGCGIGVWWGSRRERALIRVESAVTPVDISMVNTFGAERT